MAEAIECDATWRFRVSALPARLARALGCTQGQAYSFVITLVAGLVLAGSGRCRRRCFWCRAPVPSGPSVEGPATMSGGANIVVPPAVDP